MMVEVMGVSLKTENEEWSGKIPRIKGSEGGRRGCGFTLIEFAVVLFIISLFLVLVTVPIQGILSGGDLGEATRMLMSEVSQLRGEAAYTKKIQTLVLNMEQNTFYALEPETLMEFRKTEESLFKEDEEEIIPRKKDLPSGVFFEDVVLDTQGKVQEGKAEVRFFANGCVEHALIHLKNEGGKHYTLEINPVTGLIRTHEGYIDQKRQGPGFHTS
jgi:prepilin-type N-terminal cleavage/methylation domain-containing protein